MCGVMLIAFFSEDNIYILLVLFARIILNFDLNLNVYFSSMYYTYSRYI